MNSEQIIKALSTIPNVAEYYFIDNDFANIVWLTDGAKPTYKEVQDAYKIYVEQKAEAEAEAAAKKAAAEAKLAALGLTADDLKALGLG